MYNKNTELDIAQEWQKFISTGTCKEDVIRPVILESWKRSKKYGVNPNEIKDKLLTDNEFNKKLKDKANLINVATPYINNIYSFVKNSHFAVFLTDENGNILYLVGDEDIISSSSEFSKLCIGANRSEIYSGTNAIGTCIAINKPIQIFGPEHYVKYHQNYACSAATIHDEENNIIGCLDISGLKERVHSHTLGMIVAAVDGIEKELKIINAYNKIHIMNNQLSTTLNSINSAIIVICNKGKILNINQSALNLFNLNLDCINKSINNVLEYNNSIVNFENLDKNYMDIELEIQNKKYSISTATYKNENGQSVGSVISFREMKRIHKIVNKYSGFSATYTIDNIIGQSAQISYVKNLCLKASKSTSNVLILGESGTGKELVAQSIHNASSRCNEPFIAINCGALPKGLIESELFGYEGGSFTGANKEGKPGKFELADGGTIFLDEIGDMPLDTQVSLLRVLQNKEITRIGGNKTKSVDVRVIAATNKSLLDSIQNNTFREDLFYRLNVLSINVPSLKQRTSDIDILAKHFINHYNIALNKHVTSIDDLALEALYKYSWPGNIREMENILERAINIIDSDVITIYDLPYEIQKLSNIQTPYDGNMYYMPSESAGKMLHSSVMNNIVNNKTISEKDEIMNALAFNKGNAVKASESLRISRRTLYRKLDKYNIQIENYR